MNEVAPPTGSGEETRSTRRAPRSVRGKLMRVVLLTTAIAVSIASVAMLLVDLGRYQKSWATDLATEAAILGASSAPAMAFDDRESAARNLSALKSRPRVMAAALYGLDGSVYASFVRENALALPKAVPPIGIRTSGERVELAQPIERDGEILGTLYLRARYDIVGRIEAYAGILILVTCFSMLVAFVLSNKLQRGITEPLDAMAAIAREIVDRRDYSLRAVKTSDDEIGVVVDAVNNMLEEVDTRSRALEQLNRALLEEIEARKAIQATLRDADRRTDEFLATLAHELRNPLAPIRHAIKLLDSKRTPAEQGQWARDVISRQVRRMALLLDDLLDVSRITRGRLELKIETVSVDSVLQAAVETARPLIESKHHELTIASPDGQISLAVDPLRLSQAISNLLTNAAKYTDANGQLTLAVVLLEDAVQFTVTDSGIGFEPHSLPTMFEMFSQVETAMARSEGGLGIGLALVRGLVELHGGSVEGSSGGLGRGSTFIVRLPRNLIVEAPAPAPSETAAGRAESLRLKIVLADDNRDAVESLAMLLEIAGHTVRVCHSGNEAIEAARTTAPDAMILDIGMPDLTGYEVAQIVREQDWGRGIYLVALTGWGQEDDKLRARAAGFDEHLTKPVDGDLVQRLLLARFQGRPRRLSHQS
jgi:signal transduction histidine kinase/ActR/RegA family two-component response regulator